MEQSRPEGTIYNGPQGFPAVLVKVIRSFSRTQESKGNFSKKNGCLPDEKVLAYFFSYYRAWQITIKNLFGCTRSSGNRCASNKAFCVTPQRLFKLQFLEKQDSLSSKKSLRLFFVSPNMRNKKEQFKKSPKGVLTDCLEVRSSFLQDLKDR